MPVGKRVDVHTRIFLPVHPYNLRFILKCLIFSDNDTIMLITVMNILHCSLPNLTCLKSYQD